MDFEEIGWEIVVLGGVVASRTPGNGFDSRGMMRRRMASSVYADNPIANISMRAVD